MTPAEVYDRAIVLLGAGAALVQLGPSRWVLGEWRRLAAGELPEGAGGPILRSEVWGLVVAAEGSTPAYALHAAEVRAVRSARLPAPPARAPLLGPGER